MSQNRSRPSTPSRLHTYHSSFSSSRVSLASPTRSHLPQPKVLPFPDIPMRPGMSREPSRGHSPLGSPATTSLATSPAQTSIQAPPSGGSTSTGPLPAGTGHARGRSTSYADALAMPVASSSATLSASNHADVSPYPTATSSPAPGAARLAHSMSPTASTPPMNTLSTPRQPRPRAATTSATSSTPILQHPYPQSSATGPLRQEGFDPAASTNTITFNVPTSSMPRVSTSPRSGSWSQQGSANPSQAAAPAVAIPSQPSQSQAQNQNPTSILVGSPPGPASIAHDPTPPPSTVPRPTPTKKTSLPPPHPLPASVPVSPSPPLNALSDHLYRSLETGACADVRIWVRRWNVGWLVHKMVLVQSGFFHSLFMGGFSETSATGRKGKTRAVDTDDDWEGEDIELTFDDPNITRAAFEICLSRLYSAYPQLHFPVAHLPTAAQPLTPSYPPTVTFPSLHEAYSQVSPKTHLVTPRLCLSLLATATYLGQPYVLREVMAIVLRTVGPSTVRRYLDFAIGDGIGEEEWEGQDDEGARGMEKVGRTLSSGFKHHDCDEWVSEVDSDTAESAAQRSPVDKVDHFVEASEHRSSTDSSMSDDYAKVGDSVSRSASMKSNATVRPNSAQKLARVAEDRSSALPAMPHFYGFVSNKLGEACVCWLARWGLDVLNIESSMVKEGKQVPVVWGHGGIPAKFVGAILSSDALFVPNERERYHMARRVFDLRREAWQDQVDEMQHEVDLDEEDGWEEDEQELAKVFADGIYYSHMTFDDLSAISGDIDPMTALPYAPLSVLQAAHWSAADFKNRITSGKAVSDGELGLTQSTEEISRLSQRRRSGRTRSTSPYGSSLVSQATLSFSSLSLTSAGMSNPTASDALYFPVPNDDTHRIGAGGLLFVSRNSVTAPLPGIPGMPDVGPEWGEPAPKGKPAAPPHDERTFFGILRGARRVPEIDAKYREQASSLITLPGLDKAGEERWSKVEPFRFSVEFWGVDKLDVDNKERLYSQTYFYAGSYFNVYVSAIRKKDKGVQLGIYLHRQSTNEEFPAVSTAPSADDLPSTNTAQGSTSTTQSESPDSANAAATFNAAMSNAQALYRTFSVSPPVIGSPPSRHNSLPGSGSDEGREDPYVDPRDVTKAYFSITCASALGTAMVRFSSAPDSFALSQSWGWKSSALRSEEYLSVPVPATEGDSALGWVGQSGENGSLRATVVVGII